MFCPAACDVGDDEAGVRTQRRCLDTGNDAPVAPPASGRIMRLEKPSDLFLSSKRAPGRHVIAPRRADVGQAFVAREAEDVEAVHIFQNVHDLGRAVMGIAPHGDGDPGPV